MSRGLERMLAKMNSLTHEQRELRALLERDPISPGPQNAQLVRKTRGRYSFLPTSSETFAARKAKRLSSKSGTATDRDLRAANFRSL